MDLATLQLKIQSQGMEKGRSDLQGLQAEASKAEKSAQRLDAAFGNLGKAIGGALAFVGVGASLKSTIDAITGFQDSMLQLQATSRATASEMAAMEKQARVLGATSKYSASQAADAQNFLAMAGFKTGEVLAATGDVIKFASAANIGLAQSADIASNVLGQMKLPVTQLSGVMDTLISTAQSSNTNVTQLAEAFGYVGPVAAAAGVSTEELAAAIGVLGDAGIQGGRAGTGLQGVIRGLLNVTPAAAEAMSKYGLSISDVDITTHGLTEVLTRLQGANISAGDSMKIFGSESASAALNLASAADRVGELTKANEEAAGRTQEVANILDSGLSAALKSIASAAEESMLIMGESGLASALQTLAVATAGVISNFNGLLPEFAEANGLSDEFTRKIEIASAGVKVLGVGLGALALTAIPAVTSSIIAMTVAIAANPIGLLAVGAAAVVAYFISISDEVDRFNSELDALGAAWDIYADIFKSFWGSALDFVRPVFGGIIDWFGDMWDSAVEATDGVELSFESALLGIAKVFDGIVSAASGAYNAVAAGAKAAAQNLLNYFHNSAERIRKAMFDMTGGIIEALNKIPGVSIEVDSSYEADIREAISIAGAMGEAFEGAATTTAQAAVKSAIEMRRLARGTDELNKALDASTESYEDLADAIDAEWNGTKKSTQATKENTKETDSNTSSTTRNAKAVTEAQKAIEALEKERKAAISAQRDTISGLKDESASLRDQISTYGQGKWAIDELAIARLEEQKAALIMMGAQEDTIDLLRQEIEERKELLSLGKTLGDMEEETRAYEEMAAEATRMNEEIGRTLTDALMRGFEDGKGFAKNMRDTVINMFKTMVLRPIIEPVMQGVAGAITGALGVGGQSGGSGGVMGSLGGVGSLFTNFGGTMAGAMQNLGGSIASLGGTIGGDLGANLIMHSDTIGNALDFAGTALSYGNAILNLTKGNYGAAAGGAIGTYFGGPVGSFLGSKLGGMVDKLFGGGETRSGGGFAYNKELGQSYFTAGPSGGHGGSEAAVTQVHQAAVDMIESTLRGAGLDAWIYSYGSSFESSGKGRGGTSSGGVIGIDGQEFAFGQPGKKGTGYGGTSGSVEEMFENMVKDTAFSTLEAFQIVSDQMPKIIQDMLDGVNVRGLTFEQADALTAQISGTVQAVNLLSDALDTLPFDTLKGLSFDLTASLMQAAGGMENLLAGLDSYYQGFYSGQERFDIAAKQLGGAVEELGFALPETRGGFRDLVDSLEATDDANHGAIAGLLGLSGAAAQYYDYLEEAQKEALRKAEELAIEQDRLVQERIRDEEKAYRQMQDTISRFTQHFTTDAQKFDALTKDLSESINDLGYSLPGTREEFIELQQSLLGADGYVTDAALALMGLSDVANTFYTEIERQAEKALRKAEETAREQDRLAQIKEREDDKYISSLRKFSDDLLRAGVDIDNTFSSIMDSIMGSFAGLRERITLDIMGDDSERYDYYKAQYDALSREIDSVTDAGRLSEIIKEMNQVAGTAYGLLDEDVRKGGKGEEYLATLNANERRAKERAEKLREEAAEKEMAAQKELFTELFKGLGQLLENSGGSFEDAAEAINQAATNIARASASSGRTRGMEATS